MTEEKDPERDGAAKDADDATCETRLESIAGMLARGQTPEGGKLCWRVRSTWLPIIGLLAVGYTLYFARPILIPVFVGLVLRFLFSKPLSSVVRMGAPPALPAAAIVLLLGVALYGGSWMVIQNLGDWADRLPDITDKIQVELREKGGAFADVKKVEKQIEALQEAATGAREEYIPEVKVKTDGEDEAGLSTYVVSAGTGILTTLILLFFLLAGHTKFVRKIVEIVPRFDDKKKAVGIYHHIEDEISRYLGTITLINIGLGVVLGVVFYLLGLPDPFFWGAMAGVLNFIPYLGPIAGGVFVALVSYDTFPTGQALVPPLCYIGINSIEGFLVTPMIIGRKLALSPVAVIIALMFFFWIWGIMGALLAVPILVVLKVFARHIDSLRPVAVMLGDAEN